MNSTLGINFDRYKILKKTTCTIIPKDLSIIERDTAHKKDETTPPVFWFLTSNETFYSLLCCNLSYILLSQIKF